MFITWNLLGIVVITIYLFFRYEINNMQSLKKPFDTIDLMVSCVCTPLIPIGLAIFGVTLILCCLIRSAWRKLCGRIS